MTYLDSYDDFQKVNSLYKLGFLPTEMSHPQTKDLSHCAQQDLKKAAKMFYQLDQNAIQCVEQELENIQQLKQQVYTVLNSGGRVFISGCGATGRLALSIESLFRMLKPEWQDQLIGFMAGGDIALVHSLEGFEDHPEYGAKHLTQLGFSSEDLLIGVTEGGETPYVLGTVLQATKISKHSSFLLCCNPKNVLRENIYRSKQVIDHPKVKSVHLNTGPMALSGSTRLQATTALLNFLCLSLFSEDLTQDIHQLKNHLTLENYIKLNEMIVYESEVYKNHGYTHYNVSQNLALTIFTDTTERSPTFSTPSFEPTELKTQAPSWCYVSIIESIDAYQAWLALLGRIPQCLNWKESYKTSQLYLNQFDFSAASKFKRSKRLKNIKHISVTDRPESIVFSYDAKALEIKATNSIWMKNLILKMLINYHSTVLMCRMGRVESNMMTWVRPSNGKLIDRAARYLEALSGNTTSYNKAVKLIIDLKKDLKADESVIVKALAQLNEQPISRAAT